jgi:hypothetical protein
MGHNETGFYLEWQLFSEGGELLYQIQEQLRESQGSLG